MDFVASGFRQAIGLIVGADREIWEILWLSRWRPWARHRVLAAVMAGFGGVISEIGASMMVGANFEVVVALSLLLLVLIFLVNWALTTIQQRRAPG